ncbi:ABC efflux pump, inner membrane subunit [Candidatus Koribacter versatilis Ellin345]|uniref:ABC efflux pump, inner membrane subunit n=1 Tax=Koribacter versatilis (strain Ellin345) TaxID=204669 RepID=Q1IT13_KORVE|nr:ABC transporter permease [Candidatus Koribacter versatilis]ABF39987.1 ABC efflux pump, inner membrane subunit [Candidatus Koribacter versatilis Ellin345]
MREDLRSALRAMLANRGFTFIAVLTIGIGIGASTTIFGWIRTVLLHPLPGATNASRIVSLENTADDGHPLTTSFLDFTDYRDHLKLADVTLRKIQPLIIGEEPNPARAWGEVVSGNFFPVLGVQPEIGRFFSSEESTDAQNAHPVVVISHGYWVSHYGSSPAAIGQTLHINRTPFTVIGVAPLAFHGSWAGLDMEMWVPVTMYGQLTHTGIWMLEDRKTRNFEMLARLKPGVHLAEANQEAQALAANMAKADADADNGVGLVFMPLSKSHFGAEAVLLKPLGILMGASALMLLTVCANIASLLLARATARRKEFSIRLAMGARPARLTRQLLTEALALALAGALLGLLLTRWLTGALNWLAPGNSTPLLNAHRFDWEVLLFSAGLAAFVAVAAGMAPALSAVRADVNQVLNEARGLGTSGESHHLRKVFVVAEVALAVMALIGAGLFVKNFQRSRQMDPGFIAEGVAVASFDLSTAGYNARQADDFCTRLREKLEHTPSVTAVSYDDSLPLGSSGGNWEDLEIQGYVPRLNENMKIYRDLISPGFFDLMKIPLLAGRDFDLHDSATRLHDDPIQKVMIVNQEFVRRFLPGRDPLGHRVRGWGEWFTIVGVVQTVKYHQITESPEPYIYVPIRQVYRPEYGLTFHVRTSGSVPEAIASIRREARQIDPGLLLLDAQPLTEYIAGSLYGQRVAASLLTVLGGISILLAAVGLYGLMSYSVAERTSEIGIRMTLGAQRATVMSMVLKQGLVMALLGLAIGTVASLAAARLVSAALGAISPADPAVYLAAVAFTIMMALLSVAIPAWRAMRVDPMVALRYQ